MKSSRYILPVSAVALAGALVLLVLKVRATPNVEVDDKKLARAEAAYKRASDSRPSPAARPSPDRNRSKPVRATRRVNTAPPPSEPPEREPEPRPQLDRRRPTVQVNRSPRAELKAEMDAANKAYDKGDYPTAEEAALEILKDHPRNIRMLRIVVSTSCIMGNADQAIDYVGKLPSRDQAQMRKRCQHWGVELPEINE